MGASILLGKLNLFATPIKSDTISKNKIKQRMNNLLSLINKV